MLGDRCWMVDGGCWVMDDGMLDVGWWIVDVGWRMLTFLPLHWMFQHGLLHSERIESGVHPQVFEEVLYNMCLLALLEAENHS